MKQVCAGCLGKTNGFSHHEFHCDLKCISPTIAPRRTAIKPRNTLPAIYAEARSQEPSRICLSPSNMKVENVVNVPRKPTPSATRHISLEAASSVKVA